jgi:hypothetical protein
VATTAAERIGGTMNAMLNSLTEAEFLLIRETERDQLTGLDEDALVDLQPSAAAARRSTAELRAKRDSR